MGEKYFKFWYRWLLTVSLISVLGGIFIAFLGHSTLFEFHNSRIAETFFQGRIPENAEYFKQFIYGPLGGTISGYFILQFFIVKYAFRSKQPWSWNAIVYGLLTWFLIDSTLSVIHGAYFNVYTINLATLLLHAPPLVMTYNHFQSAPEE
ncbi:hypothetical protein [Gracilimonas sp.]|uniref:hypothetical protein n=1 Tax=Gracilimonas sp. TaxID=1974203 RepID=UPI0028712229|nr:hypothetical protein [Gracilimonas sp.]